MKKDIIYRNTDNQEFTVDVEGSDVMKFHMTNGSTTFYFLTPKEVDEFCEILQ